MVRSSRILNCFRCEMRLKSMRLLKLLLLTKIKNTNHRLYLTNVQGLFWSRHAILGKKFRSVYLRNITACVVADSQGGVKTRPWAPNGQAAPNARAVEVVAWPSGPMRRATQGSVAWTPARSHATVGTLAWPEAPLPCQRARPTLASAHLARTRSPTVRRAAVN